MSREVLHVVPHNQEWAVKREGNERHSSTHGTQKEAIEAARELAKERDDIVIHRPDGTIRERVTYMGGNNGSQGQESSSNTPQGVRGETRTDKRETVRPSDLFSVGSRVSWAAVAAGVAVALAMYITLSLLAVAVGVSTIDQVGSQTFRIGAAIVSAVILLGSMFLGGYVVSRTTAGEQPGEAVAYGTIMWGTAVMLLLAAGASTGAGYLSGMRQLGSPTTPTMDTARMQRELNLTPAQAERYASVTNESQAAADRATPQSIAWWTFGGVALSLLSAMAGSYFGAGPEFVLRGARRTDGVPAAPATRVEPRPA
jgi:hypothetical protein